jgi:porin
MYPAYLSIIKDMIMLKFSPLFSILCISAALLAPSLVSAAEEAPFADRLLGDMGGVRSSLQKDGVDLTIQYKGDSFYNAEGGKKTGANYLDNLDIKLGVDGEKLWNLPGNKLFIYVLNNNGGKPGGNHVGSVQGVDNIEVATPTFKLYEAWMEQSFAGDKASILVGLHDLNAEFSVIKAAGNFLKPEYGAPQEMSVTGINGPSIFPNTALAARLKVTPTDTTYVEASVFDAVAGDPDHPHGTHINLSQRDGALLITEAGYSKPQGLTVAVGGWRYTKQVDDLIDTDDNGNALKRTSQGAYAFSSYPIYTDSQYPEKQVQLFLRVGITDGNTTQFDYAWQGGVVANGMIDFRPESEFGFGISEAHQADKFIRSALQSGSILDKSEYGLEAYYRDTISPGITVQPDVQYIINPGTDPQLKNAWVIGLRVDINF